MKYSSAGGVQLIAGGTTVQVWVTRSNATCVVPSVPLTMFDCTSVIVLPTIVSTVYWLLFEPVPSIAICEPCANVVAPQPPARVIVSPPVSLRSNASEAPERTNGATFVTLSVVRYVPLSVAGELGTEQSASRQRRAVMTVCAPLIAVTRYVPSCAFWP